MPVLGPLVEIALVLLALLISRHRPQHRPFVGLTLAALAVDVGRHGLGHLRDGLPGGREHPLVGLARALYELDRAAWLLFPLALAAAVLRTFGAARTRLGHLLGAYALATVALVAGYPSSRAPWILPALEGGALVVAAGAVLRWSSRKLWPSYSEALVLLWLSAEIALYVGPLASGSPRARWSEAVPLYAGVHLATLLIQAAWLRSMLR